MKLTVKKINYKDLAQEHPTHKQSLRDKAKKWEKEANKNMTNGKKLQDATTKFYIAHDGIKYGSNRWERNDDQKESKYELNRLLSGDTQPRRRPKPNIHDSINNNTMEKMFRGNKGRFQK